MWKVIRKLWLVTMFLGSIEESVKSMFKMTYNWVITRFMISIKIENEDLRKYLLHYIRDNHETKINSFIAKLEDRVDLVSNEPHTWFTFNNMKICMSIGERKEDGNGKITPGSMVVYVHKNNKKAIEQFLNTVRDEYRVLPGKHIYSYKNVKGEWKWSDTLEIRPKESVILKTGIWEDLIEDIESFINEKEWYIKHNIPYRRCYLLHGKPGMGKSSLVHAISTHLDRHIYLLNLSEGYINDDEMLNLISNASSYSIIIIEDIDTTFNNIINDNGRNTTEGDSVSLVRKGSVTIPGLLNALDGLSSSNGRIIFMTSNHNMDLKAINRPGRIDYKIEFNEMDRDQIYRILERFYPQLSSKEINEMVDILEKVEDISPARIQNYVQHFKQDFNSAYINKDRFVELTTG